MVGIKGLWVRSIYPTGGDPRSGDPYLSLSKPLYSMRSAAHRSRAATGRGWDARGSLNPQKISDNFDPMPPYGSVSRGLGGIPHQTRVLTPTEYGTFL